MANHEPSKEVYKQQLHCWFCPGIQWKYLKIYPYESKTSLDLRWHVPTLSNLTINLLRLDSVFDGRARRSILNINERNSRQVFK